jgi:hypothetical protein
MAKTTKKVEQRKSRLRFTDFGRKFVTTVDFKYELQEVYENNLDPKGCVTETTIKMMLIYTTINLTHDYRGYPSLQHEGPKPFDVDKHTRETAEEMGAEIVNVDGVNRISITSEQVFELSRHEAILLIKDNPDGLHDLLLKIIKDAGFEFDSDLMQKCLKGEYDALYTLS